MSVIRIWAIVLRHIYPYRFNLSRMSELVIWPFFEMLLFGFFGIFFARASSLGLIVAIFLGAVLLWQIFFRIQQGISVSFLMELWSRNLTNIFVSPISVAEYLAGLMIVGLAKIAIVGSLMWVFAYVLYHVNVLSIGLAIVPLAVALILFGWAIGTFVLGIVLRYGQGAESIAWASAFFLQPFGAIFYPVSVYPEWLQKIIQWVPLPHIFEALRAVFGGQGLPMRDVYWAYGLSFVYLVAAFLFFGYMFEQARIRGYLLKAQE
jgi:ABC-2 type transport system permease protein